MLKGLFLIFMFQLHLLFAVSAPHGPIKSHRSRRSLFVGPCKYVKHDGTCLDLNIKTKRGQSRRHNANVISKHSANKTYDLRIFGKTLLLKVATYSYKTWGHIKFLFLFIFVFISDKTHESFSSKKATIYVLIEDKRKNLTKRI